MRLGAVPQIQDIQHRNFLVQMKAAIEKVSASASTTTSGVTAAALASVKSQLQAQIDSLSQQIAVIETGGSTSLIGIASAAIGFTDVVAGDGGGYAPASNANAAHAGLIAGIALAAASDGDTFTIATTGQLVENSAWSWTPGALLWIGAAGALVTSPGSGSFAQPVAIAVTATKVMVLIGAPVLAGDGPTFVVIDDSTGLLMTSDAGFSAFGLAFGAVADAAAGRTALSLGSAATSDTGDFATSAQGALADSALQDAPSDGTGYVRKDGAWAAESGGGGSSAKIGLTFSGTQSYNGSHAPLDSPAWSADFSVGSFTVVSNGVVIPSGVDHVRADCFFSTSVPVSNSAIAIYKNTDVMAQHETPDSIGGNYWTCSTGVIPVTAGDVIRVGIYPGSNGSVSLTTGAYAARFTVLQV